MEIRGLKRFLQILVQRIFQRQLNSCIVHQYYAYHFFKRISHFLKNRSLSE